SDACITCLFTCFSGHPLDLHSFPTRRSSDLEGVVCEPPPECGCTLTQGFWKNHEKDWPVDGLNIGGTDYTAAELDAIFETEPARSEEHTSELQSRENLVCRLLLEKKKKTKYE